MSECLREKEKEAHFDVRRATFSESGNGGTCAGGGGGSGRSGGGGKS